MTDEANSSEADMMGSSDMISDDFSGAHDDAPTSPPQVPAGASKLPIEAPKVVYASTSDKKPLNPDPLQRRDQVVVAAHAGDRDFGERLLDR